MADRLGSDLAEVASWGVVSGTVQSELREGKEAARQVANLTLFGPKADRIIGKDDAPIVQLLKEMGSRYDEAYANGDAPLAQKHLAAISSVLAQHESKAATRLGAALKLLSEQAKFRVKMAMHGNGDDPTVADLEQLIKDQDAQAIIKAADVDSKEDD
jgi:hypothetical protein